MFLNFAQQSASHALYCRSAHMNIEDYKIAFIGLGVMGAPMARNIIKAGFKVSVFDADAAITAQFENIASRVSVSPVDAARGCNLIITMLPTSDIVREVLLGGNGALVAAADNSLVVDMSTGSILSLEKLIKDIAARSHRFVDAPVGRSMREAITGNLIAMVGGTEADLQWFFPVLNTMADTIVHVGEMGCGLKLKLVNNYMAMVNHVLTGEVLAFADKAGLDPAMVVDVLSTTSAGKGQLLTNYPKKVLAGDITPDFSIRMGIKDLNMALELGQSVDAITNFGLVSRDEFQQATKNGFTDKDCTAIYLYQKGTVLAE